MPIAVLLFGAIIGSFLNVVIGRLPQEQQLTGRSYCPYCQHKLSIKDLVPLLSYLWLRGRCAYCSRKISFRYFVVELVTAVLFLVAFFIVMPMSSFFGNGSWFDLLQIWFILSVLIIIFAIDLEHYLILDKVIWFASGVVLLVHIAIDFSSGGAWQASLTINSLIGAVVGFLPFYILWKVSKGRWIGLGDAKLGIFLGIVFGLPVLLLAYFLSFAIGTLVAIPLLVTGKKHLTSKLPLGTFLAAGSTITLFWGLEILAWYFGLIGL